MFENIVPFLNRNIEACRQFQPWGKTIKESDAFYGINSGYMSYTDALIPGVLLLLIAYGASKKTYNANTFTRRVVSAGITLGAACLATMHLGQFIWQGDCLGKELHHHVDFLNHVPVYYNNVLSYSPTSEKGPVFFLSECNL